MKVNKIFMFFTLFLFTALIGCGAVVETIEEVDSAKRFAKQAWHWQYQLYLANPHWDFEVAKLWLKLNGMALGMTIEEINEHISELEKFYNGEENEEGAEKGSEESASFITRRS